MFAVCLANKVFHKYFVCVYKVGRVLKLVFYTMVEGLSRKVAKALSKHGKYIACCNTYLVSAEFRKTLYPQADKWVWFIVKKIYLQYSSGRSVIFGTSGHLSQLGFRKTSDNIKSQTLQMSKLICRVWLKKTFDYGKVTAVVFPQVIFTEYVLSVGYKI